MRHLIYGLMLVCAAVLAACGSEPQIPDRHSAGWLQSQLDELARLERPLTCSPDDWADMKSALQGVIEARLAGKYASNVPTGPAAAPVCELNPADNTLRWYFVSPGDYNQDGVVSISDLTPLASGLGNAVTPGHLGFTSADGVVDGDANGLITIADITPIGANLGNTILEWRLYDSPFDNAYPASPDAASSIASDLTRSVTDCAEVPPLRRTYLPVETIDPARYYWVRAFDGQAEGPPSPIVGGNNATPVLTVFADVTSGAPPFSVEFAATAADPEGHAVDISWSFEDDGHVIVSLPPVFDRTYTTEGLWGVDVYARDEMGAVTQQHLTITATAGAQWRNTAVSGDEVLANSRMRLITLADGRPAVGYRAANRFVSYVAAATNEGDSWNAEQHVGGLGGFDDSHDIDLVLAQGRPAMCWLSSDIIQLATVLQVAQADDPLGASWSMRSLTDQARDTIHHDLALIGTGDDLLVVFNDNLALNSLQGQVSESENWFRAEIDNDPNGGSCQSLAIVNGLPALSYFPGGFGSGIVYHDAFLAGGKIAWNSGKQVTPLALGECDLGEMAVLSDGSPAFVYQEDTAGQIRYARAASAAGDVFDPSQKVVSTNSIINIHPAMTLLDGLPAVVYYSALADEMRLIIASDNAGSSWSTNAFSTTDVRTTVDPDLVIVGGHPAIAYADAGGEPRYAVYY